MRRLSKLRVPLLILILGAGILVPRAIQSPAQQEELASINYGHIQLQRAYRDTRYFGSSTTSSSTTTTNRPVYTTTTFPQRPTTSVNTGGSTWGNGDIWWKLAGCETGGKYDNPNTGNGYYGYFQFSESTWLSVGEAGLAHEYSYEHQRAAAIRLQARDGWGQWPRCSKNLGLR